MKKYLFSLLSILLIFSVFGTSFANDDNVQNGNEIADLITDNAFVDNNQVYPAPLPEAAKGQTIPMDKGYIVEEIGDGIYAVMDGIFSTMFMTTGQGVIAVDAPLTLGEKYLEAIKEVTDEPIKYVIYTHAHQDHIGSASMFPDDVKIYAHEETAKILEERQDPNRPVPTRTFKGDKQRIQIGDKKIELDYVGQNHQDGNIFISVPDQKVLMAVDVIFPGWVPFRYLAISEDIPGWIDAHYKILEYDFDTLVSGHVTRLGTREDVEIQIEYIEDIIETTKRAMQEVSQFEIGQQVGFENPWYLMDVYYNEVIKVANAELVPRWVDRLGGADIYTWQHISEILDMLRLE
ncbi:MBL fold metallo-hydrolase [Chengkuizengella axinellae]|uniref:MBL fold metallo-hydrolase n=1 Tax=Chengkuizengella axinellae TaxID=3064388 RepID=A0ABT9J3X5_9BACL|nr:MBL fold metallo-hydrolase [Chengkuizengella sp. 2205SS18-9]MDP5276331.1 MBL fold metallo-hydrolase [Chengkuizengella sp. 2205SS18-9]